MLVSLSIVLLIMAAITFVVKRTLGLRTAVKHSPVTIEVLAQQTLQPKRSVYVVRIASTVLVLGSSEQGLSMFTELHDEGLMEILDQQKPEEHPDRIVLNAQNLISRLTGSASIFTKSGTQSK